MDYRIIASTGEQALIDAPDWLVALSSACARFGVKPDELLSWRVDRVGSDLRVLTGEGLSFVVRPSAPALRVVPVGAVSSELEEELDEVYDEEHTLPFVPGFTPELSMPAKAQLAPETALDVMEELFELTAELSGLDVQEASEVAAQRAARIMGAEQAAVYRGSFGDEALTLIAAAGEGAEDSLGLSCEFGVGLVGKCFERRGSIQVDAANNSDLAHRPGIANAGIYALLIAPMVDDRGALHGVMELVNPPSPVSQARVDAFEALARMLANRFAVSTESRGARLA